MQHMKNKPPHVKIGLALATLVGRLAIPGLFLTIALALLAFFGRVSVITVFTPAMYLGGLLLIAGVLCAPFNGKRKAKGL